MSGSTAEKSDFIGGLRWHVPLPDPPVSEGFTLFKAAQRGDKAAIRRCEGIFEVFRKRAARKRASKPSAGKPIKKRKIKKS